MPASIQACCAKWWIVSQPREDARYVQETVLFALWIAQIMGPSSSEVNRQSSDQTPLSLFSMNLWCTYNRPPKHQSAKQNLLMLAIMSTQITTVASTTNRRPWFLFTARLPRRNSSATNMLSKQFQRLRQRVFGTVEE